MTDITPSSPKGNILGDLDTVMSAETRRRLEERSVPWRTVFPPELTAKAGKISCKGRLPGGRRTMAVRSVCGVVRMIASEMVFLIGGPPPSGRNRRFAVSHIQQIAMYVCHVVLQLTMTDIAAAFGMDRTTVGHACARVEDRRDDGAYDVLIGSIERVVDAVFGRAGRGQH